MGQRGPAPVPPKLRVLRGQARPSDSKNAPGQEPPIKPRDLSKEAGKVWDDTLAATADTQHIGISHAATFRTFCEVVATLEVMNPKGTKEWRETVNSMRQLARELCLTPATGNNLQKSKTPERKLAKYLPG